MKAHKFCYTCKQTKHISQFYSKSNQCKKCWIKIAKIHKIVKNAIGYYDMNPKICQICNTIQNKLDLANINGHEYTINPKEYLLLCPSCHYLFDTINHSRNGME